ncbi:MAG: YciC family protein [Candidatus Buchananbacteria bacterium]
MDNNPNVNPGIKPILIEPGSLLKSAWGLYVKNWQKLVVLTLIPMIVMGAATLLAWALGVIRYLPASEAATAKATDPIISTLGFSFVTAGGFDIMPLWGKVLLVIVICVLGLIISLSMVIGQLLILKSDGALNLREALNGSIKYWVKYFVVGLLFGLITIGGLILFIVPGIFWAVMFCLATVVLIFEDKPIIESLKRSRELTKGYWWAVFGRLLLWLLVVFLVSFVIGLLRLINQETATILLDLVQLVLGPMYLAYLVLLYQSLQQIKK